MGCFKGPKCQHAHEPLPGLAKLDYTVAMQVIRRGGLKGSPKIDPKEVDGRVAQLRSQASAEKAEKIQPSRKAKPKAKAKAGKEEAQVEDDEAGNVQWEVPEDYTGPLTRLEADLGEAVQGPEKKWLDPPPQQTEEEPSPATDEQSEEELRRLAKWKALEEKGVLDGLENPSDYLKSHVIARLINALEAGQELSIETCLEDAAEHGHPSLAEEACKQLEALKYQPKAGHRSDAEFSVLTWIGDVGHGQLTLQGPLQALGPITVRDYQDKISKDLSGVPLPNGQDEEERQCLPLYVGIGLAIAEDPSVELEEALKKAAALRKQLWAEAVEAHAHLGDPPAWISAEEHFLRQNMHDCLYPHHEKDYRALQTLSGECLINVTVVVFRISYFGRLEVDLLHGGPELDEKCVFVSIHRGHMRLLLPSDPQHLVQTLRGENKIVRELYVEHWREALDRGNLEDNLVPSRTPNCARCQQQQRPYRVGQEADKPPASFETCLAEDPKALSASGPPLHDRPAFAYGPVGQEVYAYAECAGWTKGLRYQGIPCGDPVEDYEVTLLGLAGASPGPEVPNIWHLGVVGTSFCDHQLQHGGTRTWSAPEGDGSRASEVQGNHDAEFAVKLCETVDDNGRLFCLESSAPTGRYPKLWDLPCIARLRKKTGAKIIPVSMCVWGSGPSAEAPGQYHRKESWWLVSKELYPWALLLLGRSCPGLSKSHQHAPLQGPSTVPGVDLTRPAHQYAPALCAAWGLVVRAAYEEWDWQTYLQEHSALKPLEHCWADMDAPPWPVDSTLVATEPSIAGGHGVQDSTCPRCGLDPQLHAGHSCPMCGGGGSILSLQKDPTLAPKGASPQKDCTPTPTGASPQKDCTPAPTSKVGGKTPWTHAS